MGFQVWQAILVAAIPTALGIFLTFLFSRNREASTLAHQAIASTTSYFGIIETLKTVAFLQGQRIDQWEDWGRQSQRTWRIVRDYLQSQPGAPRLPDMPEMPEGHLDLRPYWSDIDKAIADISPRKKPKHGTIKVEDEEDYA